MASVAPADGGIRPAEGALRKRPTKFSRLKDSAQELIRRVTKNASKPNARRMSNFNYSSALKTSGKRIERNGPVIKFQKRKSSMSFRTKIVEMRSATAHRTSIEAGTTLHGGGGGVPTFIAGKQVRTVLRRDADVGHILPKYIIHPYANWRIIWDWLVLCFILYNAIMVPLQLAFSDQISTTANQYLSALSDFWFIVDIFVNFRTAYFIRVCGNDILVDDSMDIAATYIKGWFPIDVISLGLPFNTLFESAFSTSAKDILSAFALLKMLRLLRLERVMGRLVHLSLRLQHTARILKLLAFFIFVTHLCGCIFFAIGRWQLDKTHSNWIREFGFHDQSVPVKYTASFYWALTTITTIGYGDIVAVNAKERLYSFFVMILGCIMYAVIFGNVTALIARFDQRKNRQMQKMEAIEEFVSTFGLPASMANRLRATIRFQLDLTKNFDVQSLLNELPRALRIETQLYIHKNLVTKVTFFQSCDEAFIKEIVQSLDLQVCLEDAMVVEEGDIAREMYFLRQGEMSVLEPGGGTRSVATLLEGSYFGEIAVLVSGARRLNTIVSLTKCEFYALSRGALIRILVDFPEYEEPIKSAAHRRLQRGKKYLEREIKEKEGNRAGVSFLTPEASQPSFPGRANDASDQTHRNSIGTLDTVVEKRNPEFDRGRVVITVVEAKDLRAANRDGETSDPYSVVTFGSETYETKVLWKNTNPKWNETFTFRLNQASANQDLKIAVELFDKDHLFTTGNKFLGAVIIELNDLVPGKETCEWYPLSNVKEPSGGKSVKEGAKSCIEDDSDDPKFISESDLPTLKKSKSFVLPNKRRAEVYGSVKLRVVYYSHTLGTEEKLRTLDIVARSLQKTGSFYQNVHDPRAGPRVASARSVLSDTKPSRSTEEHQRDSLALNDRSSVRVLDEGGLDDMLS